MRRLLKILTGRLVIAVPLAFLQLGLFIAMIWRTAIAWEIMPAINFLSIVLTLHCINRQADQSFKIAWCIILLAMPVVGAPLYLLAANRRMPRKLRSGTTRANSEMMGLLTTDEGVIRQAADMDPDLVNVVSYGALKCGYPVYTNTSSRYFASGEEWLPVYIEELKKAKHFIFIEFFIIDEGSVLDEIIEVLKEKVKEGVEVKVIYDDFGSITMPWHFDRTLQSYGIEAYRFNHVRPAFIVQMNNRTHRKITVIDNNVAFTGGVNLADEYVNRIRRFGYWRDSAVMITGEAVWSMTVMFLGMLSYERGRNKVDYSRYSLPCRMTSDGGWYQPFSDSPNDDEPVSMNMHLSMITHARDYIYINTPYLIPNDTIKNALILAAKSGVDVRIITPAIPDKILVNQITKANYAPLISAGVKIYEFTPGFNHSKTFISDDRLAIAGTVNMDYRSYYLHFENGILMTHTDQIGSMKKDFEDTLKVSRLITEEDLDRTSLAVRLVRAVMNLFVPLV
ncbi:MAG: cardiolipin synthase [Solobacterium sp.]|nr:cardiolipin synthase [Solobacterium sp.]MBQ9822917.1 cardiolipin synthase [Solobacterium sp.]